MAAGSFPLLVQGDWSEHLNASKVKHKLQLYFQSERVSGGGECEVECDPDRQQAVVSFTSRQARNRVLNKTHELKLKNSGKVQLIVTLLDKNAAEDKNGTVAEQAEQESKLEATSKTQPREEKGATALQDIKSDGPYHSSAVVLKNLAENISPDILILLVETYSRLSAEEGDFTLEMLSDIDAAVVIFKKTIDVLEFIAKFSGRVVNEKKIVAVQLEITKSILVENLSPAVNDELLKLYFEKHTVGDAVVIDIDVKDSSAIISFQNAKDLDSILENDHVIDKKPILVYPYYKSLASALYGDKRPMVKMPDAFPINVNPYILQFLRDKRRTAEINDKMSKCYCDVVWPDLGKPNIIKLSPSFSKEVKGLTKLTKNWKKEALDIITSMLLKYTFAENHVSLPVWNVIQPEIDQFLNQNVSIVLDMSIGKIIQVGEFDPVNELNRHMRNIIQIAFTKQQRESRCILETLDLSPAMYIFLQHNHFQENLSKQFADLWMNYDATTGSITLCGLPKEVFGGKSYILEELVNLKRKQIEIDHSLIRFLQMEKTSESCLRMFISLGINAVHEIKDDGLELFGKENNTVSVAERSLKEILNIKEIVVESRHLLGKEWKLLHKELYRKLNYSQKRVLIEEVPFGTEVKITIFGFADAVIQVFEHLNDFVNRNAFIQKFIEVESSAVLEFLINIRKITSLPHTEKKDVKIEVHEDANQMNIKLSGPQEHVCDIEDLIRKEISLLSFSVLNLTEPGIKMYFKEEKDILAASVMHRFQCVIKSQERPFLKSDNKEPSQFSYQVQLPEGPLVTVLRGDLCVHRVDVIVNAANENLYHFGGLAAAISTAAGPMLQTTCNRIIKTQGILKPGDAVITDAGNLLCSHVIHAVGPRWESYNKEMSVKYLKRAVKESLKLAERHNLRSIAIPALSSGIFGFPLKLCAETIVQSIKEFWKDSKGRLSLQKIDLVNNDMKTVQAVSDAVQSKFGEFYIKSPSTGQDKKQLKVQETGNVKQLGTQEQTISKRDPKVQLIISCIQNMKTDVIVSSVGPDLCLKKGVISYAIYKEAGPVLQQLLLNEANANVSEGDVFVTKGCNLCCDRVFHAIVPKWDQGTGNAVQILKNIISRCLQIAEALQLKSISFPAIGTGLLGFPKSHVANIMFEEVSKFTSVCNPKFLQDIYFVLHPSDQQTVAVFCTVFNYPVPKQMLASTRIEKKSTGQVFGRISVPKPYAAEMKVGEVLLQVAVGDITTENTDVIVNSTPSFSKFQTGLSKDILDAAGYGVQNELISKGNGTQEMIITKGGTLLCKNIIHLIGQEEPEKIKSFVVKILQACEKNKITSIAFPALRTEFAEAMIQGMAEFVNEEQVIFLSNVRIVIRYPSMFDDFWKTMEKREGTRLSESESIITKTKNLLSSVIWGSKSKEDKRKDELIILADLIEPAIIHICGESIQEVENTKSWLKELALNQLDDQVITNDLLYGFGKREHEELKCLQKQLQVKIEFEYKQSMVEIRVCGLIRNVSSASFKIHQMMEDVRKDQERINNEDLIRHTVQWQFNNDNQFLPFDNATNVKQENAFTMKKDSVVVEIQSDPITVDLKKNTGENFRNLLAEGEDENIPNHWEDMNGVQVKEVELSDNSREYLDVKTSFPNHYTIVKIKRIQNPTLWKNYLLEKKTISEKNAAGNKNERILFYKPSSQSLNLISSRGFDRNFTDMAEYGKGSYFYKKPVSAFRGTYSRFQTFPGSGQLKYVFYARVITGEFCQGQRNMIIPPFKNTLHPTDLYDSMVDNLQMPSLFVIFKDIQAYPEYLIEYY